MAEAQKIAIRPRALTGKKVGRLRRAGVLPGVVFGGHKDSTPVETDMKEFERGYRRWGNTTLVNLEGLGDGGQPALIHDVTRSTLSGQLLHVDFLRVSLTEKVRADVPLHFVGESPAVKGGGVLVHAKSAAVPAEGEVVEGTVPAEGEAAAGAAPAAPGAKAAAPAAAAKPGAAPPKPGAPAAKPGAPAKPEAQKK